LDGTSPQAGIPFQELAEPGAQSVVSDNSSPVGQEGRQATAFAGLGQRAEPGQKWQVQPAHDIAEVRQGTLPFRIAEPPTARKPFLAR
jgi:hypothetical protein